MVNRVGLLHNPAQGVLPLAVPQALGTPAPPQVCGEVQLPHELTVREVPQLSSAVTLPHAALSRVQKAALVSAVHVVGMSQDTWRRRLSSCAASVPAPLTRRARMSPVLETKFDRDYVLNTLFRCDHLPFLMAGVPAVWLFGGFHPGYHEPSDTMEKLNYPKIVKAIELSQRAASELANTATPPRFVHGK